MANGLFGGPTADEVRNKLRLQQQLLNQKRIADAQIGLTGPARAVAKAVARQEQAIGNIGEGLMQGAGELFGIESLKRKEDPLVSKALKRDKDRTEILGILESYRNDSASPGIIDQNEMKQGFALLMSRGYPNEAKMFLEAAQKEMTQQNKKGFKPTGTAFFQERDGKKYVITPGVQNGKPVLLERELKDGELLGNRFRTVDEKRRDFRFKEKTKAYYKDQVDAYATERKLNATNKAELYKLNLADTRKFILAGALAENQLNEAEQLLKLVKKVRTGGIALFKNELKRFLGTEPKDAGALRSGLQKFLVKNLKPIMGARPTDKDLEELKKAMATFAESPATNEAILERFIKGLKREVSIKDYLVEDTNRTYIDYLKSVNPASAPQSAAPAPASAPQLTAPGSAQPRVEDAADLFN